MGFLDSLGKTLSEVGQTTLKKGAEVANTAKYSLMISDEERKIEKVYQEIGKKYYELHALDYEAEYSEMIAAIEDGKEKIAEYQEKIKEIKGYTKCYNCQGDVPAGVNFCPCCGAAQDAGPVPSPQDREETAVEIIPGEEVTEEVLEAAAEQAAEEEIQAEESEIN